MLLRSAGHAALLGDSYHSSCLWEGRADCPARLAGAYLADDHQLQVGLQVCISRHASGRVASSEAVCAMQRKAFSAT